MALCEKLISSCIAVDCDNPIYQGVSEAYLINKDQIDSVTYNSSNGNEISAITMKTHTVGNEQVPYCAYKVQQLGQQPFNGSGTEMTMTNFGPRFTNNLNFLVPANDSEAAKNILDPIAGGVYVAIVKNDFTGDSGKGKWQVFGIKKGLRCSAMTREFYNDDDQGIYN